MPPDCSKRLQEAAASNPDNPFQRSVAIQEAIAYCQLRFPDLFTKEPACL